MSDTLTVDVIARLAPVTPAEVEAVEWDYQTLIPVADLAGATRAEVQAGLVTLACAGLTLPAAITSMRQLLVAFITPKPDMAALLADVGHPEPGSAITHLGLFEMVCKAGEGLTEDRSNVLDYFGTIWATSAALAILAEPGRSTFQAAVLTLVRYVS